MHLIYAILNDFVFQYIILVDDSLQIYPNFAFAQIFDCIKLHKMIIV